MMSIRSLLVLGLMAAALPSVAQESASPAAPATPAASGPSAEAVAVASAAAPKVLPPEVKDGKLYSPSGDFSITLPDGWKIAAEPKANAHCDVENEKNGDVFIETEEKEDDLGAYMTNMVKGMKSSMAKLDETGRKDVTVAGFKGIQARIAAQTDKGIDLEYIITLFNGEKVQFQIVGITAKENLADNEKDILGITKSFKVGK